MIGVVVGVVARGEWSAATDEVVGSPVLAAVAERGFVVLGDAVGARGLLGGRGEEVAPHETPP